MFRDCTTTRRLSIGFCKRVSQLCAASMRNFHTWSPEHSFNLKPASNLMGSVCIGWPMHAHMMDSTVWVRTETCRCLLVHMKTTLRVLFMVCIEFEIASFFIYIIVLSRILGAFLMDVTAPSSPHRVYRIKYDGCHLQKMMVWVEKRVFPRRVQQMGAVGSILALPLYD